MSTALVDSLPLPLLTYLRPEVATLKERLDEFIENEVLPAEEEFTKHLATLSNKESDCWSFEALPPSLLKLQQGTSFGILEFIHTSLIDFISSISDVCSQSDINLSRIWNSS